MEMRSQRPRLGGARRGLLRRMPRKRARPRLSVRKSRCTRHPGGVRAHDAAASFSECPDYELITGGDTPILYRPDRLTPDRIRLFPLFRDPYPEFEGSFNNSGTKSYAFAVFEEKSSGPPHRVHDHAPLVEVLAPRKQGLSAAFGTRRAHIRFKLALPRLEAADGSSTIAPACSWAT